jgi:hypothetical protein
MLKITVWQIFPTPNIHFPKAAVPVQFQSLRLIDRLGSQAGSGQIAGETGINVNVFKSSSQTLHLPVTTGSQQRIVLSMKPAEGVPLCLTMADQIYIRHDCLTEC